MLPRPNLICSRGVMDSTMVFGTCSPCQTFRSMPARRLANPLAFDGSAPKSDMHFRAPKEEQMLPRPNLICSRSVMDSTMVFGTICSGSSPDGSTTKSIFVEPNFRRHHRNFAMFLGHFSRCLSKFTLRTLSRFVTCLFYLSLFFNFIHKKITSK